MNEEINQWNNHAKPYHKKIIDTRLNTFKTFATIIFMILALGFLTGYFIKIYYYDYYRDIVDVSNICTPYYNITVEPTNCGDTHFNCPECVSCPDCNCEVENLNCNCDCGS